MTLLYASVAGSIPELAAEVPVDVSYWAPMLSLIFAVPALLTGEDVPGNSGKGMQIVTRRSWQRNGCSLELQTSSDVRALWMNVEVLA